MSQNPKEETLKNYFTTAINGGNNNSSVEGTLKSVLDWFKNLNLLEKLKISEADVEKAFKTICKQTNNIIDADGFINLLKEISKRTKTELAKLEDLLLEQIEYLELEKQFKKSLAKGVAKVEEFKGWLERNDVLNKGQIKMAEVAEVLNKFKTTATISLGEFTEAVKTLAEKAKGDLSEVIETVTDPGFLSSDSNVEEKEKKKK